LGLIVAAIRVRILRVLSNLLSTKVICAFCLTVLSVALFSGCQPAAPASEVDSGAKKVATFDGGEVTEGEVAQTIERASSQQAAQTGQSAPEIEPGSPQFEAAKSQVMPQLLAFNLSKAYAEENGIEVSGEEVQTEIDTIKDQFNQQATQQAAAAGQNAGDPEETFQEALSQFGYTDASFREEIRTSLLVQKVQEEVSGDASPTDEEVEAFYEENKEAQFSQPEQRCIRHILFTEDQEDQAEEVKQELEDEGDFAELAEEYSQDPGSKEEGGDLGCQPEGRFVPEFDEAAFDAEEGEILGPIETDFGFHVIEVTDIQEEGETPLEEATPQIEEELTRRNQAAGFEEWIQSELDARNVKYLPGYDPNEAPPPSAIPQQGGAPQGEAPQGEVPQGEAP
jgi:peptidyl-prolyl cis-trans isomerase C